VVLHLREHCMDGVDDMVMAACLEEQGFDPQCEGSRAAWIHGLFKGTPAYPRFAASILAAVARGANRDDDRDDDDDDDDSYDGAQLRHLASLMGRDGDLAAASCLRTVVWGRLSSGQGLLGASAVCALDGMSAIIAVARHVGQVLQQDPEDWSDSLNTLTGEAVSFDDALAELRRLAHADPAIAAFLAREDANIARDAPDQRSDLERDADNRRYRDAFIRDNPVESIIAAAAGTSSARRPFLRFGEAATVDDLERILDHLREQADPDACEKLLWVFRRATLPRVDERVWALASHDAAGVRNAALVALSGLCHPRVRALGLERLRNPGFSSASSDALALFEHNFEPGDEALILSALERQAVDGDAAHALGSAALDICASVQSPLLAGLAQWVYRTNPCTICRSQAVHHLLEWHCLPAHIAAEGRHDASEELREQLLLEPRLPEPRLTEPHLPDPVCGQP
jgi:hypothetical protein